MHIHSYQKQKEHKVGLHNKKHNSNEQTESNNNTCMSCMRIIRSAKDDGQEETCPTKWKRTGKAKTNNLIHSSSELITSIAYNRHEI